MLLHLYDADAFDVVAVALNAFEMRVKFEIIDVVFAVSGGEADYRLSRPDRPQDGQRDFFLVRRDHLDPAVARAQHGGVIDLHPHLVGQGRMLVAVDGVDLETRIEPRQQLHDRRSAATRGVRLLVKVGQLHRLVQSPHDLLRFPGRGEGALARHVELKVVAVERHIGQNRDRDRGADKDTAHQRATKADRGDWQPQPSHEQHQERADDAAEPQRAHRVAEPGHRAHRSVRCLVVRKRASSDKVMK